MQDANNTKNCVWEEEINGISRKSLYFLYNFFWQLEITPQN